jgi:hypothetical protein
MAKKPRRDHVLTYSRADHEAFVEGINRLNALVNELQGDIAVLRIQVDRLERISPKPRKPKGGQR